MGASPQVRETRFAVKWTYPFVPERLPSVPASSCNSGTGSCDEQVPKLNAGPGMMILQSNVTAERSSLVSAEMTYKLAVESNLDVWPCGFDLESVPLAQRFRGELDRGCQLIYGARHVQRTTGG